MRLGYDRPVDIGGLRRFDSHLERGRLSRCIEQSPLPFGRHRWTSPDGASDIEVVATTRPRQHLDTWLAEQAATPLDVEHGPGWHLAVLQFNDGDAGVSLLVSHCLTDGGGNFTMRLLPGRYNSNIAVRQDLLMLWRTSQSPAPASGIPQNSLGQTTARRLLST